MNATIEMPKFFVKEGVWKITLKCGDKTEIITGMPNYIEANKNYEALKRFLEQQKQR